MRIISRRRLVEFWHQNPQAKKALANWYMVAKAARWRSIADTRRTFRHADPVKVGSGNTVTVFNVGGNKYRLVCAVHYNRAVLYVLRVFTHKAYDTGKWKEEL